jgi:tetracycline repressor-like protein
VRAGAFSFCKFHQRLLTGQVIVKLQIVTMLERARARGEKTPRTMDVLDHLLAPIYVRALFGNPADDEVAEKLVERLTG